MFTGKFNESSVLRVNNTELIVAIEGLLASTRPVMEVYDKNRANKDYEEKNATLTAK